MAENQYTKRLLSADSHVMEPRGLWQTRIDKKWRDKAPRIEMLDASGDYIVIDGMRPRPLAFEGPMADLKAQGMEIPVPKGFRKLWTWARWHQRKDCLDSRGSVAVERWSGGSLQDSSASAPVGHRMA